MTIDTKPLSERLRSWPKYAPTAEELSALIVADCAKAADALDAKDALLREAADALHSAVGLIGHPDDPVTQALAEIATKLTEATKP